MPIEALAVVSLVGNIIQFIEAGAKILAKSKQIYDSADGLSDDIFNVNTVLDELHSHNDRLKDTITPPGASTVYSAADASLEKLRIQTCRVIGELRDVLKSLTVQGKVTRWKSLKKALVAEWKSGKLQSIQTSLFALRDEMHFQITVSLRDNVALIALQQTESFQRLDMATQAIVNAVIDNRIELLDDVYKHTRELQETQLQAIDEAVDVLRGGMADMTGQIGQQVELSHEHIQQDVNRLSSVMQEHDSMEHEATRSTVELHTIALGEQIEAESQDTRTLVVDASNNVRVVVDRVVDQMKTIHERLAQAHLIEERSREEFRSWIVALLAQQARVIEAQAAAINAGNKSLEKTSSKRLRKTLKTAQESLTRALEVLIELAEMFEQEIGLQYRTVRELISRNMGSVDPISFIRHLLGPPNPNNSLKDALPTDDTRGFLECPPASVVPSHVLTDAADPEIEAAFLQFFDIQLGRSSQQQTDELDLVVTSGTWDMAFMSISWSVASTGPFWRLNRGYLQGLSLQDWDKFKEQKWIFIYQNRHLHVVEVTSARNDTFLSQVPLYPESTLKVAQFRWDLIAGENRLVAFEIWDTPLTSSPPKKDYLKYVRTPYSVRDTQYITSAIRSGIRAGDLQGHETMVLHNTPVLATEYGQPIRHPRPQAVWGLVASDQPGERHRSEDELDGTRIEIHWEVEIRRDSALMESVGD